MKALFVIVTLSLAMVAPAFGQAWWTLPEGSPERAAAQQAARQEANVAAQRAAEAATLSGRSFGTGGDRIEMPGVFNPTPPSEKRFTCEEVAATSVEMDRQKYGFATKADEYRAYQRCKAELSGSKWIK